MTPHQPDFDPRTLVELDVRDAIARGDEPLAEILAAADALPHGHVLHIRAPFEPLPLFRVLGARGFDQHTTMFEAGDWSSWFWRADAPPASGTRVVTIPSVTPLPTDVLDLRSQPPPEPLLRILERATPDAGPFRVALPLWPAPLTPLLRGIGWRAEHERDLDQGAVLLTLRREP
jgi:hypothetical protein